MQTREIRSVADLGGEAAGILTTLVRDMHAGIANRVFGAIGPAAKPTQIIHDAVARTIYGGVDGGIRGATRVAGALASKAWGRDGDESLESQPTIAAAIAAINGLYGDQLTAHRNGFALSMQIRHHGTAVPLTADGVAAAFPTATGRLAVFVHGLFLTERSWWRTPRTGEDLRSYGQRLHHEHGFTPVYLRYNTGLHISHNGQTLADMLHRLEALWPVPIHEIVLVGHSMGGLVTRSACYYGEQQQHRWTEAVRHVVCLGSPHLEHTWKKGCTSRPGRWPGCRKRGPWPASSTRAARESRTCASAPASRTTGETAIPTNSCRIAARRCRSFPGPATTSSPPPPHLRRSAASSATTSCAHTARAAGATRDESRSNPNTD